MKRNKGVSMITLIITIIVIIILAAIAFVGMDDATGSAQYAKFSSEFGDYSTNFTSGAVTKVQESLGLAGKVANKSQIVYCAARGVNLSEFDKVLNGVVTPGGYTSEKFQTKIKDATGATYVLADENTPCYEIKDDVMNEYKGKSFYGNSNGQETHWVTATGVVFTLPGYPRTVDGEERMYINSSLYYVPNDGDMILASELRAINPIKIGDEASGATVGNQKVADAADHANPSGSDEEAQQGALLAEVAEIGDYVDYPVAYKNVVGRGGGESSYTGWRVLEITENTVSLVSAGVPLTFYHPYGDNAAELSVKALTTNFLTTDFVESNGRGYRKSGFYLYELEEVFSNKYTNAVRSLTKNDIENIQNYVGDSDKLSRIGVVPGELAADKYDNLFLLATEGSSPSYWLASEYGDDGLWYVDYAGYLCNDNWNVYEYGIRPVVVLKSDVRITAENTGDGSESNPWKLAPVK